MMQSEEHDDGVTTSVRRLLRPVVRRARSSLSTLAANNLKARAIMERLGAELSNIASGRVQAGMYGPSYFGDGREGGGDKAGLSGYLAYDRVNSNADIAGFVIWRNFGGAQRTLEVGCSKGFVVEVLRELEVEAFGCDISPFAIINATSGARGHTKVADLRNGLPYADGEFDVVVALETLEHLETRDVPAAIAEIRRVCAGFVYATMPSFGPNNEAGPAGHFEGKVLPERLEHYKGLGADYPGPVALGDLARDAQGDPVEGHLTIASFAWWTERFADAGFDRRPDVEKRIYADIEPAGLAPYWNLYVFSAPGAKAEVAEQRSAGRSLVELGLHHPLYGT